MKLPLKDSIKPSEKKDSALAFINKGTMHQMMRKEVQYGLMPTTIKGLSLLVLFY